MIIVMAGHIVFFVFGHQSNRNVAKTSQIQSSWANVEFFQHGISTRIVLLNGNTTSAILFVAEDNRLGWASRLASCLNVTVTNFAIFRLGNNLAILHALDAVRALFHHTATANGHIWIEHQLL